jgi:hypothetical protein
MPTPCCVGIEVFISAFERQFATLYFTNQNSISMDTVPLDEYRGGTKSVLGSQNGSDLVLLQAREIAVLNRENNRVTDEYNTSLPRADAQVEYFQGKMIGGDRLRVVAEMQPSIDEDGVFDPTLHSLVFDDVRARKTIRKIVLNHPLGEFPPVFFGQEAVIFRNKRKDNSEAWKALDNSFSPVNHPLCAMLDREFKTFFIWGLVMSDRYRHAVVYEKDIETKTPAIAYVSWRTNKVSTVALTTGILEDIKNLMISPSGKWAFFTATAFVENKRIQNHTLLCLDPSLGDGFLTPRIIASGKNEDRVAWMTDPEALVVFGQGHASVWNLSKFDQKKPTAKVKTKPKTRRR